MSPEPYYQDDWATIYHGDCIEVMPSIEGIDLIIADPPYNVGKDYGAGHDDDLTPAGYESWCAEWFLSSRRLTKRAVVFPGHGNIDLWYRIVRPTAVGCWYKPGGSGSSMIGTEEWEPWLYWHGGDKGLLGGSSVVTARAENARANSHPCPKPVWLIEQLIKKCRSFTPLDPFMGSGTTLVAAKRLRRHAIGIERNERYCELAARRLAQDVLDLGAAS